MENWWLEWREKKKYNNTTVGRRLYWNIGEQLLLYEVIKYRGTATVVAKINNVTGRGNFGGLAADGWPPAENPIILTLYTGDNNVYIT